ncbi:MAG: methyl-accepting chemotaxis protein, partial [Gammaproteobacteria bacterium]|nr:methyl-accepting chemotaxis protein [Gammaproteobacteria bacterium]
ASEALGRMASSGLMQPAQIKELNSKLDGFRSLRVKVLENYHALVSLEREVGINLDAIDRRLMLMEDKLEANMDGNALTSLSSFTIQSMWDVADAIMEIRIGLLTASHAMGQLGLGIEPEKQKKAIQQGLDLASEQVAVLVGSQSILKSGLAKKADLQTLKSFLDQQVELVKTNVKNLAVFKATNSELVETSERLLDFLAALEESGDSKVEGEMDNIQSTVSFAYSSILIVIITGLIVAIVVYILSIKLIVNPIVNVASNLKDIAEKGGDLTQKIKISGNDEVTDLSKGFNLFMDKTREIISQVKQSSTQVSSETSSLNQIIEETVEGALNQSSETEQVASAVTEMIATVANVASHADEAASVSEVANSNTEKGRKCVQETADSIQRLAAEMKKATEVINQVMNEADNIGGVLDVIKSIAEQTNLLALNAAIEAARAGEQGRGFAVVADEVRTLASRTQESTTEIQAMIDVLQEGTKNAVDVILRSHEQTEESVKSSLNAGETLNDIFDAMTSINAINQQIAIATKEQETTSRMIGSNADNIYSIAESTAEKANLAKQSTNLLQEKSNEMNQLVSSFKT